MKTRQIYLILLIIPFITILYSVLLKSSVGPFYFNSQYDPSYVYLINSLNVADLVSPAHVDHPGTPLQITGALAIKAFYFFNGRSETLTEDVIKFPENYLNFILNIFLIINVAAIFYSGLIIHRSTESILSAVIIQLSPFLSLSISYSFFTVSAEIFLIPVSMMLIAYSVKYIFDTKENDNLKYLFIFSILCGIGLAIKINFFPLILIPLILLKGYLKKIFFLLLTLLSFSISTFPALSKSGYFFKWASNLIIHDGIYGSGKAGVIDTGIFKENLFQIFSTEIIFSIFYLIMFITVILYIIRRSKPTEDIRLQNQFKLLTAIFLTITLQIFVVAKHYNNRYMLPGLILAMTGFYLTILINSKIFPNLLKSFKLKYVYLIIITLISVLIVKDTFENYIGLKMISDDSRKLENSLNDKLKSGVVINSFGCSSREYALAFSTKYAGRNSDKYKKIIEDLYPRNLYFENWSKNIYSLSNENIIGNMINSGENIYIRSTSESSTDLILKDLRDKYNIKDPELTEIGSASGGEKIYELKFR